MWSYQSMAHGADSLMYFRYRGATKGAEQFCYGVIDADNVKRRKFYEVQSFFRDMIQVQDAEVLFHYADAFYLEFAAVMRKQTGRGTLYYVSCGLEEKITKLLMEQVMRDWHFQMVPSEEGLEIVTRGNEKQKVTMYINHNAKEVTYGDMTLAPFACKILEA